METSHTISYHTTFTELAHILQGELKIQKGEYRLFVNNAIAFGKIKGTVTNSSKLLLEIDLKCDQDIQLPLTSEYSAPLHFIYCQNDPFSLGKELTHSNNTLEEFQTAIVIKKAKPITLQFKAKSHVKVSIITIQNDLESTTTEKDNIYQIFYNKMVNDSYEYIGSHNLKIMEQIARLHELEEEGIVRKLLIEGTVQLVLAMEIQNHQNDLDPENQPHHSLTKTELKKIQALGMDIKQKPEEQYTIKELTLRSGISAAKLQDGFKHLFGRTVTDYIKNVRIELAEKLIKTTDYTISEIVYSIGFTSRSYFSKIFRERYNCSPRSYQVSQRYQAMSA